MARVVKLICLSLMILYVIGRFPVPLLVIPLVGCTVIYISNEVEEIKSEKCKKKNNRRNKKVAKKSND
jgi:hypothetical protein